METSKQEGISLKGVYTFWKATLTKPEHFWLQDKIKKLRDSGKEYMHLVRILNEITEAEKIVVENLVPTAGRALIAQFLGSTTPSPSTLYPNYVALGSSVTAPANGDTTLTTETYRNAVASRTSSSNVAYITGFFTTTETTGTYRECGLFVAGTASANTGTLMSHVAINITKSGTDTLTLDWAITIS